MRGIPEMTVFTYLFFLIFRYKRMNLDQKLNDMKAVKKDTCHRSLAFDRIDWNKVIALLALAITKAFEPLRRNDGEGKRVKGCFVADDSSFYRNRSKKVELSGRFSSPTTVFSFMDSGVDVISMLKGCKTRYEFEGEMLKMGDIFRILVKRERTERRKNHASGKEQNGSRWKIECMVKTAKTYLGLEKTTQAIDYLQIHATTSILMVLEHQRRMNSDEGSYGDLFAFLVNEVSQKAMPEALKNLLAMFADKVLRSSLFQRTNWKRWSRNSLTTSL